MMSESNKQQAVNKLTEIVANFTAIPLRSQRQSDFPRWPHRAQKRRQMGDGLRRPDNQYAYGKF